MKDTPQGYMGVVIAREYQADQTTGETKLVRQRRYPTYKYRQNVHEALEDCREYRYFNQPTA